MRRRERRRARSTDASIDGFDGWIRRRRERRAAHDDANALDAVDALDALDAVDASEARASSDAKASDANAGPDGRERGTRRAVKARDERRGRRARTMNAEKRAEIYTYEAPWMIYACNWSVRGERGDGLGASAGELNREGRRRRRDGGDSGTRANGRSEIKNGDARVKTRMAWTDDVELNATGSTR